MIRNLSYRLTLLLSAPLLAMALCLALPSRSAAALLVPGTAVSLQSLVNGLYVNADNGGSTPLIANSASVSSGEIFTVVDAGNGSIGLKSQINGMYVSAENAGSNPLQADRPTVGTWETFTEVGQGSNNIALKSLINGEYVCADNAGASPLIANRTSVGLWETFTVHIVQAVAPTLANTSFETPSVGNAGYQYNPAGGAWTFSGNSGLQSNGSAWGAANAPDGTQTAFLQGNPNQGAGMLGSISQSVSFATAGTYLLTFQAAQRWGQVQPLRLSVDGVQVGGLLTPASSSFNPVTVTFSISSAGTHTLTLSATDGTRDASTFVDQVRIAAVLTSAVSNASFETPSVGNAGYQYNPAGGGWTFSGNSGLQSNGSIWFAPNAPDGTQTAFLQGNPNQGALGSLSQSVNFVAGSYALTFQAARRQGQVQPLKFSVDGVQVGGLLTPTGNSFAPLTSAPFTISAAGAHTIALSATNSSADLSSFVDQVSLASVIVPNYPKVYIGSMNDWGSLAANPNQWNYVRANADGMYANFIQLLSTIGNPQALCNQIAPLMTHKNAYYESDSRNTGLGGFPDGGQFTLAREAQEMNELLSAGFTITYSSLNYGVDAAKQAQCRTLGLPAGTTRPCLAQNGPWTFNGDVHNDPGSINDINNSDGVSTDGPLDLWLSNNGGMQQGSVSDVKYARSLNKLSVVMVSPGQLPASQWLATVQQCVRYQEAQGGKPDIWSVFAYDYYTPTVPETNPDGSPANTVTGAAFWLIHHVTDPTHYARLMLPETVPGLRLHSTPTTLSASVREAKAFTGTTPTESTEADLTLPVTRLANGRTSATQVVNLTLHNESRWLDLSPVLCASIDDPGHHWTVGFRLGGKDITAAVVRQGGFMFVKDQRLLPRDTRQLQMVLTCQDPSEATAAARSVSVCLSLLANPTRRDKLTQTLTIHGSTLDQTAMLASAAGIARP